VIQVENLTKYYGPHPAIQDVTFQVKKGEILGFLGPNAAGKTTTMRILTGFMPPTSGTARVAGYDVFADSIEVRRRIGYMPETIPLYPEMAVRDYLGFFAEIRGLDQKDRRVDQAMEICNVGDRADTLIGKLSKGYQQRVGLAQALLHDPEVLILDEPTVGLDPKQIIEVRELIKSLGGERTVILSTHILPEVSQTCSRVVIINEGRVVAEDTTERLTNRLQGAERIFLKVQAPGPQVAALLEKAPGVLSVEPKGDGGFEVECALGSEPRPALASAVVRAGYGLLELRPMGMSLEEVFLKLTSNEEKT